MSKKTKQETKNTYDHIAAPITPQIQQLQTTADNMRNNSLQDTVRAMYARQREEMNDSFDNPFGAYTTQAVRDASKRASSMDLFQREAQAAREAQAIDNEGAFGRGLTLAQLTAPKFVQTGGTSTTTESGLGNILGPILGTATGLGSAAITGGATAGKFGRK